MADEIARRRMMDSRIMKVWLIATALLVVAWIIDRAILVWISQQIIELAKADKLVPEALGGISDQLSRISLGGAIGTTTTAVIARYGVREATGNLRREPDGK